VAVCRKCDAHKKGDLGFCELLFIARLPCCDVPLLAYQPYLVYGATAFATYIIYQKTQPPSMENNAGMLMADNIWTFIAVNQVFQYFLYLTNP
jgi:hypothetical protein